MPAASVLSLLLSIIIIIIARLRPLADAVDRVQNACKESGEVMLMSENGKKAQKVWLGQINCAHCGKPNSVRVEKETIEPAVPAETEIRVTVEKSLQTVLA